MVWHATCLRNMDKMKKKNRFPCQEDLLSSQMRIHFESEGKANERIPPSIKTKNCTSAHYLRPGQTRRCRMSSGSDGYPSPVISRQDALAFTIPQTYHTSPVLTRVRGFTDIQSRAATSPRDFCLKSKSLENVAGNLTRPSIGHVSLEIWYSQEDELLMIRLLRVDLLAKPSAAVISSTWQVRPEVKVCLLHEKRKFWESGQSKAPCTLVPHSVTFIHIKKGTVKEQVLKLTVLDSLRKNEKTPIGFVFVTFNDIDLTWKSSSYVREIVPSSEFSGFSTGLIHTTLRWDPPSGKLNITLGTVSRLKSPHGTLKRFFFARIFVFVSGVEVKQMKSQAKQANPDTYLDVNFCVNLHSHQINESCILIHVYAKSRDKLSFTPELIGSAIIGPYMPKVFNSFTHWENMIANPLEDIRESHELYL